MAALSSGSQIFNHDTDRRALRALYKATGGAGWKTNDGWKDNSDDLSTWFGVSVKPSSGRVFALIMRQNNLNGAIPSAIWDLTELEHLDFGENRLLGEIPVIPENRMEKLYVFNVNFNRIAGIIPDLHLLPNLEEAYLDTNRFTGSISESIGRCQKLKKFFVSSNKLEGELPPSLGKLTNMTKFKISDNGFSGVIPEECANMSKLREFKVDYNTDLKKPGNARVRNRFNQWVHDRRLEMDLADLPFASSNDDHPEIPGDVEVFPVKEDQGMLFEGPLRTRDSDCLGFADYAEVLASRLQDPAAWPVGLGIFAQWGAGKSSLCEMIIQELPKAKQKKTAQESWFIRWLWRTTGGAALYALAACLVIAVSERCCLFASSTQINHTNGGEENCGPGLLVFGRCCGSSEDDMSVDNAERGAGTSGSSNSTSPAAKAIVASFNAWLFADSKVLWAVLVSKIFEEVENNFGKGAVRATRVHHAIASSTCMDWCTIGFTIVIVVCVAAAVVWIAGQIDQIEEHTERLAAGIALAGVPTAIVSLVIKALPVIFKSQGQVILSKAEAMRESVGAAHVGFMAEVQEEIQVLLGMLKTKSSKDEKYLLVVSIDNLDRCPHRQIVRVLEAVHLLLENNEVNVAVILALDPRLIIAAIEKDMGDSMCQEVSGSEYLDKIIHWPFCIPGGTKKERTSLLHNWLQNQDLRRRPSDPMVSVQGGGGANAIEGSPFVDGRLESINEQFDRLSVAPGGEEVKASAESTYEEKSPQPTHGQPDDQLLAPGDKGGAEAGENTVYEEREPHHTPTRQDISSAPSCGDDFGNTGEPFNSTSNVSSVAASVNEQGSYNSTSPTTIAGPSRSQLLARQSSYRAQTSAEVTELEKMITKAATTPRKAKRVCNIYSIQRELAIRRATKMGSEFSNDDALKLLRWTILSEFWPFHTACLAAIIPREEGERQQKRHTTLRALFNYEGLEFLSKIFGGKSSSGNTTGEAGDESSTDFDSSSRFAARRLIGMDEEYEGFSQLLGSHPELSVADFDEDKLGLLRLSINLNPAMVAKVTSWRRSKYESNG